ncbi:MAG: YpdA family putative bacillithiol disulfide reductase [Longimicrobiales bacterium]
MSDRSDIAVVGAGPCGIAVGVAAGARGLSCVLFDKGCLTRSITRYPHRMEFFSTPERLEIGDVPFTTAGVKPTRLEALKYYRKIAEHFRLVVHQYEEVIDVERDSDGFLVRTRTRAGHERTYPARHVVVATGYVETPNRLDVPGEDLPNVFHYFDEPEPFWAQRCTVVGGGNSAVDAALALYRAGAEVRIVHFLDELDRGVKPWVLPDVRARLEKGDIEAFWGSRVLEIGPEHVEIRVEETGETRRLDNDWVFLMTGYGPDQRLLRRLGVEVDERAGTPSFDPATLQTNVPGVFLAGVAIAGYDSSKIFIENGRHHGARIVAAILGEPDVAELEEDEDLMSDGMLAARGRHPSQTGET